MGSNRPSPPRANHRIYHGEYTIPSVEVTKSFAGFTDAFNNMNADLQQAGNTEQATSSYYFRFPELRQPIWSSDMESTLRYLKAASARKPIVREKVNAAFAGMAL